MKRFLKGIKWTVLLTVLFAAITLTIISCLYVAQEGITDVAKTETLARDTCSGGEFRVMGQIKLGTDLWKPIYAEGEEVYCVQPGTSLNLHSSNYKYKTKESIIQLVNESEETGPSNHGCAPDVKYYLTSSDTYYRCSGGIARKSGDTGHLVEDSTWTDRHGTYYENLYDIAFVISWLPHGQMVGEMWDKAKQQAIWQSQICQYDYNKEGSDGQALGAELLKYAVRYKTFYERILEEDPETGKTGMKPESLIPVEEVKLDVDQEDKIYKLGPFKLDYVDGKTIDGPNDPYGWFSYGGISDMYLIDDEGNHIDITAFIVDGKVKKAYGDDDIVNKEMHTFFSPRDDSAGLDVNENLIDWFAYQKAAPLPGQEFYVEFKYPGQLVGSVKLHVDFKYLVCEMQLCLRDGFQYFVNEVHRGMGDYGYHCHPTEDHSCSSCCWMCAGFKPVLGEDTEPQDGAYVTYHNRYYEEESFELLIPPNENFSTTMKIGGKVFEDMPDGKESLTDGVLGQGDINLANIEVTLYEVQNNQLVLAKLATKKEENPEATDAEINDPDDYMRRTNPTLTDEQGYYEFRGVDVMKKYVVKFTYNGQEYMPTDYLVGGLGTVAASVKNGQYSSVTDNQMWKYTSKATEMDGDRQAFDNKFASIGSSPNHYVTGNSLQINQYLESASGGLYNEVFHTYELAGFTLNAEGLYEYNEDNQLVDTYLKLVDGQIVDTSDPEYEGEPEFKEGIINKTIKEYIQNTYGNNPNHAYPTDKKTQIYQRIAGNDEETWKKIQFIEDCKINAFTKSQNSNTIRSFDTYPVYNYFTTYVKSGNKYPENSYTRGQNNTDLLWPSGSYQDGVSVYENHTLTANGYSDYVVDDTRDPTYFGQWCESKGEITYQNIYQGQLQINLGLWTRQEYDIAMKKDVYKATVKINGRTEIYGYNEREIQTDEEKAELKRLEEEYGKDSDEYLDYQLELENRFWEIQERIIGGNYDSYYGTGYTRELYESDYEYDGNNQLEAYITYKITIRNQSQSILAQIDEVVDYYDSTYEFMEDMSWIMYDEDTTDDDRNAIRVKEQDFYDIMVEGDKSALDDEIAQYYRDVQASNGTYANNTKFNDEFEDEGYNTVYINGLSDHKMATGETAYIYLTFKINGEGNGLELETATTDPGKQNIAEINGYSTFYADGTKLPNNITKNSDDVAGLVDKDSKPGNFTVDDLNNRSNNNRYEQNFEDDADRARGLTVTVEQDLIRKINGTVWEDKRTYQSEGTDALVGNGIREDGEVTISGIKVELHEVVNGVTQDEVAEVYNGSTFVPAEATTDENGYYYFEGYIPGDYVVRFIYGGEYNAYYNGQDYKSTSYQQDHINDDEIDQSGRTDVSGDKYDGYEGYRDYNSQNDTATFGYSIHKSDEYPANLSDAKDIWESSYDFLSEHDRQSVNEYSSNSYNGVTYDLANQLNQNTSSNQNTQMVAETGVIRMEFEYNRQSSEGNNTYDNNGYRGDSNRDPMDYDGENNTNEEYYLQNVDFGLEERPKAGLELNKQISNIRVVLANQNVLFDANEAANNLVWEPKVPYNVNDMKEDVTEYDNVGPNVNNGAENVYSDYTRYDDFRTAVVEKVNSVVSRQNGILQITMDEELMHGATIEITYDVTVTNIGEEDYNETKFYYIGEVENINNIVKTSADVVIDYVPNNMQFRTESNHNDWGWGTITQGEIGNNGYVSSEVSNVLSQYNTIITTQALGNKLYPQTKNSKGETQANVNLILTQTITPQNSEDDMSYDNIAEIVQISNDVGRRMAYSVQGNQDPTDLENLEVDSSKAERVVILPPFGEQYLYLGLGIFIVAMIGIAVIVIRKVVLNKNRF